MNRHAEFPSVIRIEPSSLCNQKCSHCPTGTVSLKQGLMNREVFLKTIDQISEFASKIRVVVLYHGGEPLLNKDFFYHASMLKELGIPFIKTVTNGMLLTKEMFSELCNNDIDQIEFSLDGQSAFEHNLIRVNSDADKIIQNIKELINYKKNNKLQKPSIYIASTQFIDPELFHESHEPSVPQWIKEILGDDMLEHIDGFKMAWAMVWPDMNIGDQYSVYEDKSSAKDIPLCDHVLNTCTIRSNGDVVPCCYDLTTHVNCGNILHNSMLEIWNGKQLNAIREAISAKNFHPLCAQCNVVSRNRYLIFKKELSNAAIL